MGFVCGLEFVSKGLKNDNAQNQDFFFFFSQKKQLCDSCYTTVEEMCVHMHTCVHIYAHINTPTRPVTLCTQFPAKLGKEILVIFDDLVKGIAQGNLVPSRFMLSGYVPAAYPRCSTTLLFLHDVSSLPRESSFRILFLKDEQSGGILFTALSSNCAWSERE